jgi:hypothetical protein
MTTPQGLQHFVLRDETGAIVSAATSLIEGFDPTPITDDDPDLAAFLAKGPFDTPPPPSEIKGGSP